MAPWDLGGVAERWGERESGLFFAEAGSAHVVWLLLQSHVGPCVWAGCSSVMRNPPTLPFAATVGSLSPKNHGLEEGDGTEFGSIALFGYINGRFGTLCSVEGFSFFATSQEKPLMI